MKRTIAFIFLWGLSSLIFATQSPGNFKLTNQGLSFSAKNGDYQGLAGGRISYNAIAVQNTQNDFHNGGYLEELYSFVSFTLFQDWQFFQDASWLKANKLENLNISYVGSTWFNPMIGQFTPSFGFNNDATTPYTPMIGLALPANALAPGYNVGAQLQLNNKVWSFFSSITGPQIAEDTTGHAPLALTSRLVFSPLHKETAATHVAISLWQQYPSGSNSLSFDGVPEDSLVTLIGTGDIPNVKSNFTSDLEFAMVRGPYDIQAEYFLNHLVGYATQPDLTFRGYYVEAGYFLTGDSLHYNYPGGYIDGVNKSKHGYGAWQVNAQFSTLNLNNLNILGGVEKNMTVGLNWYFNENFIVKFNAQRVWARLPTTEQHYTNNVYALGITIPIQE